MRKICLHVAPELKWVWHPCFTSLKNGEATKCKRSLKSSHATLRKRIKKSSVNCRFVGVSCPRGQKYGRFKKSSQNCLWEVDFSKKSDFWVRFFCPLKKIVILKSCYWFVHGSNPNHHHQGCLDMDQIPISSSWMLGHVSNHNNHYQGCLDMNEILSSCNQEWLDRNQIPIITMKDGWTNTPLVLSLSIRHSDVPLFFKESFK